MFRDECLHPVSTPTKLIITARLALGGRFVTAVSCPGAFHHLNAAYMRSTHSPWLKAM